MSKFLLELRKWAWLILAVLAVLSLLLIVKNIRQAGAYAADKAAFERKLQQGMSEISRLTEEKTAWAQRAAAFMAAADSQHERVKDLEAALAGKQAEAEALKRKIAAMPPDEIVTETRMKLGVVDAEIHRSALGITFSLPAARLNLARLYDADFSLAREQQYTAIIDAQKAEALSLRQTIDAQTRQIQLGDAVAAQYSGLLIDYSEILRKSERQSKWLKVTIGGVAVGVTATAVYLLLK